MFTAHLHVRADVPEERLGEVLQVIRASAQAAGEVETDDPARTHRTVVVAVEGDAWIGIYDTSIEHLGDGSRLAVALSRIAPVVLSLLGEYVLLGLFENGERVDVHTESAPGDADRWARILRRLAGELADAWRPGDATAEDVLDAVGAALGWGEGRALVRVPDLAESNVLRLRFEGRAPGSFIQSALDALATPRALAALAATSFPELPIVAAHVALAADRSRAGNVARQAIIRWNDVLAPGDMGYRFDSTSAARHDLPATELATFLAKKRMLGSSEIAATLPAGDGFGLSSSRVAKTLADPTLPILSFWLGKDAAGKRDALKELVHDLVNSGFAVQAVVGQIETVGKSIDLQSRGESLCSRTLLAVPDDTFWLGPAFRGGRPDQAALRGLAEVETVNATTRVHLLDPSQRSRLVVALASHGLAPASNR